MNIKEKLANLLGLRPSMELRADQTSGGFWQNPYTGLGTAAGDRTMWTMPTAVMPLDFNTLAALWLQDPIAGLIVDAVVDDGMRAGFQINYAGESDRDRQLLPEVRSAGNDLGLEAAVRLAAKSARALGGAAILPVVNGGDVSAARPISIDQISSVDRLIVADARDLTPTSWVVDEVEYFTYAPARLDLTTIATPTLHQSHLILFPGVDTSARDRQTYFKGWDRSVLQRVWEKIRDFQQNWASATAMLQNGSMGVLKVPKLWKMLTSMGRGVFVKMLADIQQTMWIARIFPISSDEEFTFEDRTFAGVADLLHENQPLIAMAADMPVTRLFGVSPAGMNATGVSDERNWLSRVASYRRSHIVPSLNRLMRLIAKTVGATDLAGWSIQWPELEVITTSEQTLIDKTTAETDAMRIASGLPASTILLHRFGSGEYTGTPPRLSKDDRKAIEAMGELELEALLTPDHEQDIVDG